MKIQKYNPRGIVLSVLTLAVSGLLLVPAQAQTSMIWSINANGFKEVTAGGVSGQGDPDGFAIGTLELNNGTGGNTGFAIINLTLGNIGAPDYALGGWHIHQAASTTTGPIVLDFGQITPYLSGNTVSATIENLSSATINNVFANSSGYYLNIHSSGPPYPGGTVRDQLTVVVPEPASAALLGMGAAGLLFRRRRI